MQLIVYSYSAISHLRPAAINISTTGDAVTGMVVRGPGTTVMTGWVGVALGGGITLLGLALGLEKLIMF